MTAEKKQDGSPQKGTSQGSEATRKAWTPKSPVEVVLEQIRKQEKKVADMQKELEGEKTLLGKLQKAKAALEA